MGKVWLLPGVAVVLPVVAVAGIVAPALSAASQALTGASAFVGSAGGAGGVGDGSGSGADAADAGQAATPAPAMFALYRAAAATCPGLRWQVLAGIGAEESGNGTSTAPGVHSGANYAGAEGPMQFEPATFAEFARPVPPGGAAPPSPYDPADAVYAAARMLCADGGARPTTVGQAIFAYNHSASYVAAVVTIARSYGYGAAAVAVRPRATTPAEPPPLRGHER